MHAFVVLRFVFPYQAKRLSRWMSPKWPIVCRVGRQSVNLDYPLYPWFSSSTSSERKLLKVISMGFHGPDGLSVTQPTFKVIVSRYLSPILFPLSFTSPLRDTYRYVLSRLRTATWFTRPIPHTERYCSFINYDSNLYQVPADNN